MHFNENRGFLQSHPRVILYTHENFTTEQAASELRNMSAKDLKKNILLNIKKALEFEDYAREYAKYL